MNDDIKMCFHQKNEARGLEVVYEASGKKTGYSKGKASYPYSASVAVFQKGTKTVLAEKTATTTTTR